MIILILETAYNITEFISLMKNIFHMHKNTHYKVYLLNKKLDETLCENTNDEENNEEQHIIQDLMKIH